MVRVSGDKVVAVVAEVRYLGSPCEEYVVDPCAVCWKGDGCANVIAFKVHCFERCVVEVQVCEKQVCDGVVG